MIGATSSSSSSSSTLCHSLPHLVLVILCFFSAISVTSSSYPLTHERENGVIQLIIRAYTDNLLKELQSSPRNRLSGHQIALLRQRMTELYDHIRHHPALYQRYLWVGRGKPQIDPDVPLLENEEVELHHPEVYTSRSRHVRRNSVQKRSRAATMFPPEEICKTNRQWEQVNRTHDFYDHEVQVVQDDVQQFVFSYRCVADGGPCIGISPLYDSECTERYGWMYMYYRRVDHPSSDPQWGYVAAPHHCACKITPKFVPEV